MQSSLRNIYLLLETFALFVGLGFAALALAHSEGSMAFKWGLYAPILFFQGFWLYRFYVVGHEASHRKLFPNSLTANTILGSIALLPLLVPLNVYRKIHLFHHGFNRKDPHTSALDTFVVKNKNSLFTKLRCYLLWYLAVFCGGFFLHSLISVLLFLFLPPKISRRISPAFKGWSWSDQLQAQALFLVGLLVHAGFYWFFGSEAYLYFIGFPFLAFAWVLSLLVYALHYDTSMGEQVRYNVRSVKPSLFFSWVLMNFNEHATHHQYPHIPWYELPKQRKDLPEPFLSENQKVRSLLGAVLQQLKGPILVNAEDSKSKIR